MQINEAFAALVARRKDEARQRVGRFSADVLAHPVSALSGSTDAALKHGAILKVWTNIDEWASAKSMVQIAELAVWNLVRRASHPESSSNTAGNVFTRWEIAAWSEATSAIEEEIRVARAAA
jgi:hypothetical protein